MDWRGVTQQWVRDGLITEAQREPLVTWLQRHAAPDRWLADRLLPALIALSLWLLTGSALVVVDAVIAERTRWVAVGFGVAGAMQVAAGLVARRFGQRGLATGAVAAGWVVTELAGFAAVGPLGPVGLSTLGGLWAVGAAGAAVGLRSRGVAVAALLVGAWSMVGWLDDRLDPVPAAATAVVCFGTLLGAAGALRRWPAAASADPLVILPSLALFRIVFDTAGRWPRELVVAGAGQAALGVVLVALAAVTRSVGFLVAGLLAFGVAEAYLLDLVGSPFEAAALLGGEGLLVSGGAVVFLLWRSGRERRPLVPPGG